MSIRQRKWESAGKAKSAWVADYFDQGGKRHLKTFRTKKEADAWLVDTRKQVKDGIHTAASDSVTVTVAGENWIAQGVADGLEPSTLRQYRQHLNFHISPLIGTVKLADLTPAMVRGFRDRLLQGEAASKERSRAMAKKVVGSLGAILATALESGQVGRNVVRDQQRQNRRQNRLDKRHAKHLEVGVDIPTKEDILAMLTHARGRWRPLVEAAIFTGLRASELRGLRWDDVDLERGRLTVRQRADRWSSIGSPKSDAGKREVPLGSRLISVLKEWRLACPKGKQNLVFPNTKGNVESLPNMHRRGLGALQVAAGIVKPANEREKSVTPKYGLHALRHACASLWIEEGFTPKRIQAMMGHSSIQVTFDTYGHLFPSYDSDRVAMERLAARLVG
jgi:integrase